MLLFHYGKYYIPPTRHSCKQSVQKKNYRTNINRGNDINISYIHINNFVKQYLLKFTYSYVFFKKHISNYEEYQYVYKSSLEV